MLDSVFNNLSISGWHKDEGNRPPALSASSLSSIGEDLNHRIEGHKVFIGNPQTSSPKSPASATTSASPNGRSHASSVDTTRSFLSRQSEVDQLGSNFYSNNSLPILNPFDQISEVSNQNQFNESRLFNRPEHRPFLPFDHDRNPQSKLSDSEKSIGGSAFGIWNSHQNFPSSMSSLYENEEFLDSRTRSFSSTPSLDFVHNKDVNSNRVTTYSYTSSIPSAPNDSSFYQRHRVQSADAVYNNSLRNQARHFETGGPMHYEMNRARSFSTGYTNANIQSNHSQNWNRTQREYLYKDQESIMDNNFGENSSYRSHRNGDSPYSTPYLNQDPVIRLSSFNTHRDAEPQQYYDCNPNGTLIPFYKRTVYTVKFKRSQKNFFLSEHINSEIKIGSYVRVEADRGEDLGIVLSRIPIEKFNPGARLTSMNMGIPDLQLKCITCLASEEDIAQYALKEEEEAELLKICRSKTLQRRLPMNVIDAEYQFDRHKLTFFFEASGRVDFRELVRDLFSIYKTRIWMQQVDKVSESPSPEPINLYGSDW
jgi:hypothetical protein